MGFLSYLVDLDISCSLDIQLNSLDIRLSPSLYLPLIGAAPESWPVAVALPQLWHTVAPASHGVR